jgi:hypothetical protein
LRRQRGAIKIMSRSYGFELSRLQRSVLDIISGFPGYSTSGSATKLQRTAKGGSKSQPSNSEDAARQVASRNGQVRSLDYPKPRAMDLNLDGGEQELYQSKMEFYQQASPFYFSGVWGDRGPVFLQGLA